jgi:hypothetical protein
MVIKFKYGSEFLDPSRPGQPDVDKVYSTYGHNWNISKEEYKRRVAEQRERERRVTPAGRPAPDFELESLSPAGDRTGTMMRLSRLKGRPVALAFGSYT